MIERRAEPPNDAFAAPSSTGPQLLDTLRRVLGGRYDVVREIGRGGSAVVFVALDRQRDEQVAIKVLRPEFAAAVSTARFVRETEIARQLSHPNILPLYDSGEVDGVPYYTMPYVEGETLRHRLGRERQLPIDEAIAIMRAVAETLDFAHAAGVIHRDIKPANILLGGGRIFVADFGIARAMSEASLLGAAAITIGTPSGVAIGTPEYMSPEQATAERELDGRSDVYALACVVYETLAGEPPFTGPTTTAIIARQCHATPPSLRVVRPSVPPAMQAAIERALAKVPADRFRTAGEFAAAVSDAAERSHRSEMWRRIRELARRHRRTLVAAGVVIAGAFAWQAPRALAALARHRVAAQLADLAGRADTTRYLVLPVATASGVATTADVAGLVRSAIGSWQDLSVADDAALRSSLAGAPTTVAQAGNGPALLARAGRYVRTSIEKAGDSLRLHAAVVDARSDTVVGQATLMASADGTGMAAAVPRLVEAALFSGEAHASRDAGVGTTLWAARALFLRGSAAVDQWELGRADSLFRRASERDPRYAAALLWLAQVRAWTGVPTSQWGFAAEQALPNEDALDARERLRLAALVALERGARADACSRLGALTRESPGDFTAWYGLGNCLRYDSLVVRDARSPSGWSFRSTDESALAAYERAFLAMPAGSGTLARAWLQEMQTILHVSGHAIRPGRAAAADTGVFFGSLIWRRDSLVFVPYRAAEFDAARVSPSSREAVVHARARFLRVARMWRTRFPGSPEAMEAVAMALDLLGNASAVDTLHHARALVGAGPGQISMAALEVRLRVKAAAPDDTTALRNALILADSMLSVARDPMPEDAELLSAIAALTGRATTAARFARLASASISPALEGSAPALLAFAALNGPSDSIARLAGEVERGITTGLPPAEQEAARAQWLNRAAWLAVPDSHIVMTTSSARPSRSAAMLRAWRAHDSISVRQGIGELRSARLRAGLHSFDISADAQYTEAAMLAAVGDRRGAEASLSGILDSLVLIAPRNLSDAASAGALVRAMVLRARLANADGDHSTARRWASAVTILWSEADPFLKPAVDSMRSLAR